MLINLVIYFCWGLQGFSYNIALKAPRLEWGQERGQLEYSQKNKLEYKLLLLAIYKDRSFEENLALIWLGTRKVRGVNSIKIYVVLPSTAVVIFEMFFGSSSIITYFQMFKVLVVEVALTKVWTSPSLRVRSRLVMRWFRSPCPGTVSFFSVCEFEI